jgi:hypothetical protein
VDHGDLKASHVLVADDGSRRSWLIDLEGVRFPRSLSEGARRESLAQLNASLPDAVSSALRWAGLGRYACFEPFVARSGEGPAQATDAALRWIVARSLERQHRWTGADCACAAEIRRGER